MNSFDSLDGSKLYYINRKLNLCMAYTGIPTLFDYRLYYAIYPDLRCWMGGVKSYTNALSHYVRYGQYEDRIKSILDFYERYPDFNWQYYVSINNLNISNEYNAIISFCIVTRLALPKDITIRYYCRTVSRTLYLSNIDISVLSLGTLNANSISSNICNFKNIPLLNCSNIITSNLTALNKTITNIIYGNIANLTNIYSSNVNTSLLNSNIGIISTIYSSNINTNYLSVNTGYISNLTTTTFNSNNSIYSPFISCNNLESYNAINTTIIYCNTGNYLDINNTGLITTSNLIATNHISAYSITCHDFAIFNGDTTISGNIGFTGNINTELINANDIYTGNLIVINNLLINQNEIIIKNIKLTNIEQINGTANLINLNVFNNTNLNNLYVTHDINTDSNVTCNYLNTNTINNDILYNNFIYTNSIYSELINSNTINSDLINANNGIIEELTTSLINVLDINISNLSVSNSAYFNDLVNIDGQLIINGDLHVHGTYYIENVYVLEDITVEPIIALGNSQVTPVYDIGILGLRGPHYNNVSFIWKESNKAFNAVITDSGLYDYFINVIDYVPINVGDTNIYGNLITSNDAYLSGNVHINGILNVNGAVAFDNIINIVDDKIGIFTDKPQGKFQVNGSITIEVINGEGNTRGWTFGNYDSTYLGLYRNYHTDFPDLVGYFDYSAGSNKYGVFDFTGQHRSHSEDFNSIKHQTGYIVSATGKYLNLDGSTKPTIDDSLPIIKLSNKYKDKTVFGVISSFESNNSSREYTLGFITSVLKKEDKKDRIIINSVGEGAIWVCNLYGKLHNGDYITTCKIPGLGVKQHDDVLHNYTVAKITCDCYFNNDEGEEFIFENKTYRKVFVGCTYHCG